MKTDHLRAQHPPPAPTCTLDDLTVPSLSIVTIAMFSLASGRPPEDPVDAHSNHNNGIWGDRRSQGVCRAMSERDTTSQLALATTWPDARNSIQRVFQTGP